MGLSAPGLEGERSISRRHSHPRSHLARNISVTVEAGGTGRPESIPVVLNGIVVEAGSLSRYLVNCSHTSIFGMPAGSDASWVCLLELEFTARYTLHWCNVHFPLLPPVLTLHQLRLKADSLKHP